MHKIIEAIQTMTGRECEIPNVGRNDLPDFFKEMGYKVGVEIGVAGGHYSEILAKNGMKIYGVDPYSSHVDYDDDLIPARMKKELKEAKERLKPYDWTLIRKTSMNAVKDFEDESIDFVYIDGHHGLKYVVEDIDAWSKKVRKGGTISGHDFVRVKTKRLPYVCHVKQAVRAWTDAWKVHDWYVLGQKHFPKDGSIRDRWRSWMWIKK